jgi:hypothetical protein
VFLETEMGDRMTQKSFFKKRISVQWYAPRFGLKYNTAINKCYCKVTIHRKVHLKVKWLDMARHFSYPQHWPKRCRREDIRLIVKALALKVYIL